MVLMDEEGGGREAVLAEEGGGRVSFTFKRKGL